MNMDRRKPVARYVLLVDQAVQERLAQAAELGYRRLVQADTWAVAETLSLPSDGASEEPVAGKRRGLRRRAAEPTPPAAPPLAVTGAIAAATRTALEVPDRIAARGGCAAEGELASSMGGVILELVGDVARDPVTEQPTHVAYRQTVRLAAELRALDEVLEAEGCTDSTGCVAVRGPGAWGRREEDVEVTEVLSVLQQLARH